MSTLRIAVLKATALVKIAKDKFPNAKIVEINSLNDFFTGDSADALLTTAEEGSTMTLLYPFYDVALIEPSDQLLLSYAYPVAKTSDDSFLMLINYWLKMQNDYGRLQKKYDYWILGKDIGDDDSGRPPLINLQSFTPSRRFFKS
jgi:hypothetical protein